MTMADALKNTVDVKCGAYNAMALHWDLITDLCGGTLAMRTAGEKWLPREPKEDSASHLCRLSRSVLFPAYSDTVSNYADKPFSTPVNVQGKLPDSLASLQDNCDNQGTNINQFTKKVFADAINRGLTHILVDSPVTPASQGQTLTIADEQRLGVKPYFVHIKADQLIGWRWEKGTDGKPKLTMIQWTSCNTVPDGTYGEKTVKIIRVMTLTTWEIHTENDKGEYVITETGVHNYPDGIPLVTYYINETGFMQAEPPFEGLAWLNLAHWQGYSDQKNLLRWIRFALLFFKGITQEELDKEVIIGPGRKFSSSNPNADAKFLEHSGAGAEAGRLDLKDMEERMERLGLMPLIKTTGNQTATGQAIDESHDQSSVQSWIRSLEIAIKRAYEIAAKWMKVELPADFAVIIYKDFGLSLKSTSDIDSLIKLKQAHDIDHRTELLEIKRRGLLSETADIDKIIEAVNSEGPPLGMIGSGGQADDDPSKMTDEELLADGWTAEEIKTMRDKMAGDN